MDFVLDLLATVSRWSRSNLSEIALALVGCLLVLFGSDIKGWLEQRISGITGALRIPLIALLCAVGSGAALIYATPWVVRGLSQFNNYSGTGAAGGAGADRGDCGPQVSAAFSNAAKARHLCRAFALPSTDADQGTSLSSNALSRTAPLSALVASRA